MISFFMSSSWVFQCAGTTIPARTWFQEAPRVSWLRLSQYGACCYETASPKIYAMKSPGLPRFRLVSYSRSNRRSRVSNSVALMSPACYFRGHRVCLSMHLASRQVLTPPRRQDYRTGSRRQLEGAEGLLVSTVRRRPGRRSQV